MPFQLSTRLWVYTNYDCNLSCSYCVVRSHPKAGPRAMTLETFRRVVDEALPLGFDDLYLTGGEPFLLPQVFEFLDYALPRISTTVLTNATVLTPQRLERLAALPRRDLALQVSVDSANPELNDLYRGAGSWRRTMRGLEALLKEGFRVRIGGTATPEAENQDGRLADFFSSRGLDREDVFIRPLVRRGFSMQGKPLYSDRLIPEVCVDRDGVYWHPLSTDPDFRVTREIFPFSSAVGLIRREMERREREGVQSLPYQ